MWTTNDNTTLLANINCIENLLDEELKFYQLFPAEGYGKIRVNVKMYDADGYTTTDVENCASYYETEGGIIVHPSYDFLTNEMGFEAILIESEPSTLSLNENEGDSLWS